MTVRELHEEYLSHYKDEDRPSWARFVLDVVIPRTYSEAYDDGYGSAQAQYAEYG